MIDGGPYEVSLSVDEEETNLGNLSLYTHCLEQIYRHGELGGTIKAHGDKTHHLVEDLFGCLGKAIAQAIGDGTGLERMSDAEVPLDGTFAKVRIDFGGRGNAYFDFQNSANQEITGMLQHAFTRMAAEGRFEIQCTIGRFPGAPPSAHHEAEVLCKTFGRAVHHATRITRQGIPSTKGVLS
jgi:imidazoleglycerol-phosphate dehydratase